MIFDLKGIDPSEKDSLNGKCIIKINLNINNMRVKGHLQLLLDFHCQNVCISTYLTFHANQSNFVTFAIFFLLTFI